jgi:Domain of unknown function (DUF4394)
MSFVTLRRLFRGTTLAAAALLGACGGDSAPTGPGTDPGPGPDPAPGPAPAPAPAPTLQGRAIFGLTCANQLVLFGSGNPGTLVRQVSISGMPAGHAMEGIDFRPADGKLYGVGSDSRVYTIDTLSGAASPVGGGFAPAAAGEHFGLAFSGTEDRLRLHGVESNQNLSLDPVSGSTASADPDLAYAAGDVNAGANPGVTASAYLESAAGSILYGIEGNANTLVTVSPATGTLTTVATFGLNVYLCSGLDIDTDGTAYAALATDDGNQLYTIDLASAAATLLGDIAGSPVHSIALRP